jgi:hypothetical protein
MSAFSVALERDMTALGAARCELLRRAAVEGDDLEGLQDAARSYRFAIIRLRRNCSSVDRDLAPPEIQQVVATMMTHASAMTKRMLIAELTGNSNLSSGE